MVAMARSPQDRWSCWICSSGPSRERETQEAYREMLPFNDDPDIKRIIEGFVRQEQHHENIAGPNRQGSPAPATRVQPSGFCVPSSPNCHGTRQRPWRECSERVRRSSRDRFATGLLPEELSPVSPPSPMWLTTSRPFPRPGPDDVCIGTALPGLNSG